MKAYTPKAQGWTRRDATHLLWRCQFGASEKEVQNALNDGLEKSVARLLTQQEESATFSETSALLRQTALDTGDISYLKTSWLYRMAFSANPLVEKMSLFWHNHFATSNAKVRSTRLMAAQNDLIRQHALGDFKDLLSRMSRDVAMLIWLDGNANKRRSPNENFAREVMELFSLGVGNYSEHDIKEAARAFSGWHVRREEFWFNRLQHDQDNKTVFQKTGNLDGDDIIALCIAHDACAKFLATKLLREFVSPAPSEEAVNDFAQCIRGHRFDMRSALRDLLVSELFFSEPARHSIIKSPVCFVLGTYRALEVQPNFKSTAQVIARLGQDLFQPPTVKGWEGGRLWITSATLLQRANFAATLSANISDIAKTAELLLARDADISALSDLRTALPLLLSMPEYQLT